MSTLAATLSLFIDGSLTKALDLTTPKDPIAISESQVFTNGTGSNQGNEFFSDRRTLNAGNSFTETIDLAASLTNAFGVTLVFAKIKAIFIHNLSKTTTEILTIDGDAVENAGWLTGTTPAQVVGPNGWYVLTSPIDGLAISTPSQHELTLDSGANELSYDLIIIGNT